jgi:hypothetical protein
MHELLSFVGAHPILTVVIGCIVAIIIAAFRSQHLDETLQRNDYEL